MRYKNNGQGEENILQNQFTRYLIRAIRRDKGKYLKKQSSVEIREISRDSCVNEPCFGPELPVFELVALEQALSEIKDRDRYIFFARVLDERSFEELAAELGLGYKGVSAAYYRTVQKLRQIL